ncbi:MAG: hypothetical protein Q4E12_04095 [Coriobacteriia bacterium]|nr:hypothetical protein [Coriobacteriia bacterium]
MWISLIAAAAVALVFLYVPGYFLFRAARLERLTSLVLAPFAALVAYGVLAVVLEKAGVFTTWAWLFLPTLVVCLAAACVSFALGRKRGVAAEPKRLGAQSFSGKKCALTAAAYVCVGLVLVGVVYLATIGSPEAYLQEFDNVFHTGTIRYFVKSGCYSVFSTGVYPEGATNPDAVPFYWSSGGAFYPAAWHCLCAMIISATGVSIAVSINAVAVVLVGITFPLGACVLLKTLFPEDPLVVACGALGCLSFAAIPWDYLYFGPLYPNLLGICLLPVAMVCFISLFEKSGNQAGLALRVGMFVGACAGIVLAHPNTLFSAVVLLAPFLCLAVSRAVQAKVKSPKHNRLVGAGVCALCAVCIAVIWVALYFTPFMQNGPLADWWPSYASKLQTFVFVAAVAYKEPAQMLLAVAVVIGAVAACRSKQHRWLVVSYVLIAFIFLVDINTDGMLKSLMAGFWYTDSHRVGATLAMAGIPLACLGLATACRGAVWVCRKVAPKTAANPTPLTGALTAVVLVVFCVFNFVPTAGITPVGTAISKWLGYNFINEQAQLETHTAFGMVEDYLRPMDPTNPNRVYTQEESRFMDKVKEIVPAGEVILNQPNDGSCFAAVENDANVYYRYLRGYDTDSEKMDSWYIRDQLYQITTNANVQEAVKNTGAHYVVLLDAGDSVKRESHYLWTKNTATSWYGLDAITDETPGFEVVLSEGDMRLYRIQAV